MKDFIYADCAATAALSPDALEAMLPWLTTDHGNASQPHMSGQRAREAVENARETVSGLIGASHDEIVFTSGGTESDNWAIRGFAPASGKRRIIASAIEHHAVLNACREAANERQGATEIDTVPVDAFGIAHEDALPTLLKKEKDVPTLVSVMLANNEIGTVEPIKKLAGTARAYGAYFHTDAVAAAGKIPIDVADLGVDLLSASAHKFGGPQGVGFLYIKKGTPIRPLLFGGSQERSMRAGTENVAGIVGAAAALRSCCENMERTTERLTRLENRLLAGIRGTDHIRNGAEYHVPGLVSISFRGADGETILHRLDLKGIAISTGAACDSVRTRTSHVIGAIGVPAEYANGTVRISFGANNTEDDADRIAAELLSVVKEKL
ncbi:MAG: cysteine desulfurase [Clostridia bacterium]|nr:cysteine desulfurase [Clostridia bacterium]